MDAPNRPMIRLKIRRVERLNLKRLTNGVFENVETVDCITPSTC